MAFVEPSYTALRVVPGMNSSLPRVTVLLTVYNGMPYLEEAVQSILGQSCSFFRFLIIDNGSTDGSGAYLGGLDDPRICLETLPRTLERTEALNLGLSRISTDFTAIIDADDVAMPERLAMQIAFLDRHPDVVLVGSQVKYIDTHGQVVGRDDFPEDHQTLLNRLAVHNQFAHAACMYRTNASRVAGGYPETYRYAQDFGLWLALIRQGGKVASIAQSLAAIRVHPGQATKDKSRLALRREEHLLLVGEIVSLPGISRSSRQAARLRRALILWQLGRRREGCGEAWSAFAESPLLFFVNPLLWRRVVLSARRLLTAMTS